MVKPTDAGATIGAKLDRKRIVDHGEYVSRREVESQGEIIRESSHMICSSKRLHTLHPSPARNPSADLHSLKSESDLLLSESANSFSRSVILVTKVTIFLLPF